MLAEQTELPFQHLATTMSPVTVVNLLSPFSWSRLVQVDAFIQVCCVNEDHNSCCWILHEIVSLLGSLAWFMLVEENVADKIDLSFGELVDSA